MVQWETAQHGNQPAEKGEWRSRLKVGGASEHPETGWRGLSLRSGTPCQVPRDLDAHLLCDRPESRELVEPQLDFVEWRIRGGYARGASPHRSFLAYDFCAGSEEPFQGREANASQGVGTMPTSVLPVSGWRVVLLRCWDFLFLAARRFSWRRAAGWRSGRVRPTAVGPLLC